MISILIIVPYPELEQKVNAVFSQYPNRELLTKQVSVVTADDLWRVDLKNCDVIVARGYTARRLKADCPSIPVIEINISGYDVIRSIQECQRKFSPRRIAFVGFYPALLGVEEFSSIFDCDIRLYIPKDYDDIENTLDRARQDGCDTIIGGYSVCVKTQEQKLDSIIIRTGEEAILQALDEAVRTVQVMRQERLKAQMYQTITQSAKDGILYVDHMGLVQVGNRTAATLGKGNPVGQPLADTFPSLEEGFREVLESGGEIVGELKKLSEEVTISVDYTPVVVQDRPAGVVITFQNITRVQQLEGQIRKKLSDKGLRAKYHFQDIIHSSRAIDEVIDVACRYAKSNSNILIVGETGTGKELFAQSIHNASNRKDGPFVAVNCAALPENLLESELFGYVEGAFTGTAKGGKMGLFELSHNGTLFLDEVSEISVSVQSKLLRVLQEHEVRRIGDDKVISVNVRLLSATNKNLGNLVSRGLFRQDLLYRLDVLKIYLPPLRRRGEDVTLLFTYLLEKHCRKNGMPIPQVAPQALELLESVEFRGNVRELRNIVERVSVLRQEEGLVTRQDLERALYPEDVEGEPLPAAPGEGRKAQGSEWELIQRVLLECGGNQTRAAKLLGIDRTTLWRKLQKYSPKP